MTTKSVAWNTGTGNITLTYNGQGNGPISIQSDANNGSARSQVITVETVGGAITRNLTVSQAACPFPVGDVRSYSYTGSYQEVELPAGQYKLQCWGAQGGSNAAASSYSITAKAGGKGGYSEGIITLSTKTTVRVYVGGAGSSSAGGFNGGGSTTGSSTYNASNEQGVSRMGGGGGATDIRLSDGALLSRMIVAGGGAGGAMCYKAVTTSSTYWSNWGNIPREYAHSYMEQYGFLFGNGNEDTGLTNGNTYRMTIYSNNGSALGHGSILVVYRNSSSGWLNQTLISQNTSTRIYYANAAIIGLIACMDGNDLAYPNLYIKVEEQKTTTTTDTYNDSQVGGVGGGTQGGAYSSSYAGTQNAAGGGGSFGQGANQVTTAYRYCSGAGGGGWYGGGGGQKSDSSMTYCKYSGGGSGWVNIAANAGNRPSGYTGLELDSGETKAGNTSFPSTSGGTETGHSGNGYAKITRLA